uniref:Immunoglobulin V-set domain-containing protein n=1 Tax=Lates calcarifer TaxID=8187 RepID=A0A4W6BRN2_LATCA
SGCVFLVLCHQRDATVEWRCCEPKPMTVHVHQDGRDRPDKQDEFYQNRTQMKKNPLRTGDLSLTLTDPSYLDRGTYVCSVRRHKHILIQKVVQLQVTGQYRRDRSEVRGHYRLLPLLQGVWSLSSCRVKAEFTFLRTSQSSGSSVNRTEMNEDLLRTGDFSLTLKHPTDSDTGRYTCTVLMDKHFPMKKEVKLRVKGQCCRYRSEVSAVDTGQRSKVSAVDTGQRSVL